MALLSFFIWKLTKLLLLRIMESNFNNAVNNIIISKRHIRPAYFRVIVFAFPKLIPTWKSLDIKKIIAPVTIGYRKKKLENNKVWNNGGHWDNLGEDVKHF